jgi:hypothetical protein
MHRLIAGLFLAVLAANLYAQTMNLRGTIPFDFRAGETVMPAGEYTITHAGGFLTLPKQGGPSIVLLTNAASRAKPTPDSRMEFHRYGERYFLSSVWTQGSDSGREIPASRAEKELARQVLRESAGVVLNRR